MGFYKTPLTFAYIPIRPTSVQHTFTKFAVSIFALFERVYLVNMADIKALEYSTMKVSKQR